MPFRIRGDVELWFSRIADKEPLKTKFDLFYFCLLLGLLQGRKSVPREQYSDVTDFVDNFVQDYKPVQSIIVAMMLLAEIDSLGLELADKEDMRRLFDDYLDAQSPTRLSDNGMSKLNQYASGGFDYLVGQQDTKPYKVEEFLRAYSDLLRTSASESPNWIQHTD